MCSSDLIAFGLLSLAISSAEMATWNLQVDEWSIIWTGFLQGLGAGIMLVPTQVLAFSPIPAHQRTEATGTFNMVRNLGASVGVSLTFAYFVHVSAVNHAQMTERITPYHAALQTKEARQQWDITSPEGHAKIEKEIARQAAMFGYTADFALLAAGAVLGFPILFLMGNRKQRMRSVQDESAAPMMIIE